MKERDAKTNQSATALCVHTAVPDAASAARRHVVPLGAEAARVLRQLLQRWGDAIVLESKVKGKGGNGGDGSDGREKDGRNRREGRERRNIQHLHGCGSSKKACRGWAKKH